MRKRIDFNCPHCKKKSRISIYDELTSENINEILTRDKFTYECPECNEKTVVDHPFKFIGNGYSIYYSHDTKGIKGVDRICTEYSDLKEKIMIFEEGLNDILIEYAKAYVNSQTKSKDELRFDGISDDNICFYDIDKKESIGLKRDFYDYLNETYKYRDVKDIEITSENFIKFVKKR